MLRPMPPRSRGALVTRRSREVCRARGSRVITVLQAGGTPARPNEVTISDPAGGATLSFWIARSTEDWSDFVAVEAHRPGLDDWTTLSDANGHTGQDGGRLCPYSAAHPFLAHYLTVDWSDPSGEPVCIPPATTGWSYTSSPTCGTATASRWPAGRTSGSTRGSRPTPSGCGATTWAKERRRRSSVGTRIPWTASHPTIRSGSSRSATRVPTRCSGGPSTCEARSRSRPSASRWATTRSSTSSKRGPRTTRTATSPRPSSSPSQSRSPASSSTSVRDLAVGRLPAARRRRAEPDVRVGDGEVIPLRTARRPQPLRALRQATRPADRPLNVGRRPTADR